MLTVAPPVSSGSRLLRTCWGRLPKSSTRCDELDAFDGDELAACSFDPRDCLVRILDHGCHVMGVGVHDAVGIARDRDMALPEQEISPFELCPRRRIERLAERGLLHVAVAEARDAGGV